MNRRGSTSIVLLIVVTLVACEEAPAERETAAPTPHTSSQNKPTPRVKPTPEPENAAGDEAVGSLRDRLGDVRDEVADDDPPGVIEVLVEGGEPVQWHDYEFEGSKLVSAVGQGWILRRGEDGLDAVKGWDPEEPWEVTGITFSPDGKRAAVVAASGPEDTVMLLDLENGAPLWDEPVAAPSDETGHTAHFGEILFLDDGRVLAAGEVSVKVIGPDGEVLTEVEGVSGSLRLSDDQKKLLATGGEVSTTEDRPDGGWGFARRQAAGVEVDLETYAVKPATGTARKTRGAPRKGDTPNPPRVPEDDESLDRLVGVLPGGDRYAVHLYEDGYKFGFRGDQRTEIRSMSDGRTLATIQDPPGRPSDFSSSGELSFHWEVYDESIDMAAYSTRSGEAGLKRRIRPPSWFEGYPDCAPTIVFASLEEDLLKVRYESDRQWPGMDCDTTIHGFRISDGIWSSSLTLPVPGSEPVRALAFEPGGTRLAVVRPKEVEVYDALTGESEQKVALESPASAPQWFSDGSVEWRGPTTLRLTSTAHFLRFRRTEREAWLVPLDGAKPRPTVAAPSRDWSQLVLVESEDGAYRLQRDRSRLGLVTAKGEEVGPRGRDQHEDMRAHVDPEGRSFLAWDRRALLAWRVSPEGTVEMFRQWWKDLDVTSVAVTQDGRLVAVGTFSGRILLVDPFAGESVGK